MHKSSQHVGMTGGRACAAFHRALAVHSTESAGNLSLLEAVSSVHLVAITASVHFSHTEHAGVNVARTSQTQLLYIQRPCVFWHKNVKHLSVRGQSSQCLLRLPFHHSSSLTKNRSHKPSDSLVALSSCPLGAITVQDHLVLHTASL